MDNPQISMTLPAVAKVKALIAEDASSGTNLRMFVQGGGCSGFQYGFTFEDVANEDDHVIVVDGVTLLVDVMSMQYLVGATVDFEENIDGTRFVVKNPNAQSTCGCGSSFSV